MFRSFTIGVGDTARPLDAELTRMTLPRRVLVGSRANIEAFVSLGGYGATKVLMSVREDGRAIKTEEFNLRGNDTRPSASRLFLPIPASVVTQSKSRRLMARSRSRTTSRRRWSK
jgi:hypothetical protein